LPSFVRPFVDARAAALRTPFARGRRAGGILLGFAIATAASGGAAAAPPGVSGETGRAADAPAAVASAAAPAVFADDPELTQLARESAANPKDVALRFRYGLLLLERRHDADALAVFTQLTQDYPELADPYNNIALLEARAGRLESARTALLAALRNDPELAVARRNLGEIELRLAVRQWELALAARPDDVVLQRKLAAARELLTPAPAR
jgi:tetratricopeptide (TPR) repeat protein